MSTATEPLEASEQDVADIEGLNTEYRPLIKVWQDVLAHARQPVKPIDLNEAVALVQAYGYTGLQIKDAQAYLESLHAKLAVFADMVDAEAAENEKLGNAVTAAEDGEFGSGTYRNIIFGLHKQIQAWELDWRCTDEDASVQVAAIAEAHKFAFGDASRPGLLYQLDSINFQFTESDQEQLIAELNALREER